MTTFTSIVISGGELKAITALGCIYELLKFQSFDRIKNLIGTSAGALICAALAIGYTPQECLELICDVLTSGNPMYKHITTFDLLEVINILDTYGCFSGDNLQGLIDLIFTRKLYDPAKTTFLDIAKRTGKNLVIAGANITKECNEFFCVDNTPAMPVAVALRITCSVPFLFAPVQYGDCFYVDGMVFNNCPINYLNTNLRDIFAVNIFASKLDTIPGQTSFGKYIYNLVMTMQRMITKQNMKLSPSANVVTIDIEDEGTMFDIETMSVKLTKQQIDQMFKRGRELAIAALQPSQVE